MTDAFEQYINVPPKNGECVELKKEIAGLFDDVLANEKKELLEMSEEGLEAYWLFKYNPKLSLEYNQYELNKALNIYMRKCRQWEELHYGDACVVERVRDKYFLPKLRLVAIEIERATRHSKVLKLLILIIFKLICFLFGLKIGALFF